MQPTAEDIESPPPQKRLSLDTAKLNSGIDYISGDPNTDEKDLANDLIKSDEKENVHVNVDIQED